MNVLRNSDSCKFLAVQSRHYLCGYRIVQSRWSSSNVNLEGAKPYDSIPGLSSLPLIGPLHHFLPVIGEIGPDAQMFKKLGNMRKKYGPIMKMKGVFNRADSVFLFKPEHFEQVFRAEETLPSRPGFQVLNYYREVMRKDIFQGVYGLSTAEGAQWREMRTKVNPAMLKPKFVKLYSAGLEAIADDMVNKIGRIKDDEDISQKLDEEITKWALESVAFVGLGARLGSLEDNLPEDHPSKKLMQCAQDMLILSFTLEVLPSLWKYYPTKTFKKLIHVLDVQWENCTLHEALAIILEVEDNDNLASAGFQATYRISTMYINKAKKAFEERGDIPEEDKSIIEKLLAIDPKIAVMMGNEMLSAGIDTVAFTTMNLMYRLAINPNAQDKVREEMRQGESSRYLKACLKEALRIWHVVPANLRRSTRDHIVGGYHIPAGIDMIAPNEHLSNLDENFPRAIEFLPERWLVDKTDPLYHGNAHPMINLPFGFGVRSCIGRRIAELEIEIFIRRLLSEYKINWEGKPMKMVTKLLNTIAKPVTFKFEPLK